ncbi:MAG TPA: phage minor capsid protein [Vitreimonas sp.]|nr:phage minor capsid protein [Vitreimonas sp.]
MARPTEVPVNEREIARITSVYKNAYAGVLDSILKSPLLNNFHRTQVLAQIKEILKELGHETQDFTDGFIKARYESGFQDATTELSNMGLLNKTGFSLIHKEAVSALVSETQMAFGESISGVYRSATNLLSQAVKEQIKARLAEGTITGETRKKISDTIKATLLDEGMSALVDKGGKQWTLDRYAEMLVRTKAVEARNTALANRMLENGYDLVEVSDHHSKHKSCADWEGKILSLTGSTPGYPTLDQAKKAGLFHPNCKHAINVIHFDLAAQTSAYSSRSLTYSNPQ